MTLLLVLVGGGLGAVVRWVLSVLALERFGDSAIGTATVNTVGSFMLGLMVGAGAAVSSDVLTVGVAGGLTTFSTWMVEVESADSHRRRALVLAVPLALGLAAAWLGYWMAG